MRRAFSWRGSSKRRQSLVYTLVLVLVIATIFVYAWSRKFHLNPFSLASPNQSIISMCRQRSGSTIDCGLSVDATMDACERVGCCYHPGSGRCTFALDLVTPAAINHSAALRPVYIKNAEAMLSSALSPSNPVQVAFVLVQTGAVRESKADSQATHVVLFTAKSMPLVPPFVKVLSLTNIAPDGILPASLLAQHENAFAEFDFVFSISPELAFVADVCWDMLGHRVAVHDPLMYSVPLTSVAFDSRPASPAFVPADRALAAYSGLLFGGARTEFVNMVRTVAFSMAIDGQRPEQTLLGAERAHLNRALFDQPPSLLLPPSYAWPEPPTDASVFANRHYARDRYLQRRLATKIVRQASAHRPAHDQSGLTDLYRDVTVAIKAFERPACLENLVLRLYEKYPRLRIVVLDDSSEPLSAYFLRDNPLLRYVRAPYNVGLSRGRNLLVAAVETPFMVLMDDDFGLGEFIPEGETGHESRPLLLELMLETIARSGADIVGGDVQNEMAAFKVWTAPDPDLPEFNRMNVWTSVPPNYWPATDAAMRRLEREQLRDQATGDVIPECWNVDMVDNFFIARTAALKRVQWDNRLLVGEHEDYFLRAKAAGLRVAYCRGDGYYIRNLGTNRCLFMRAVDARGQPDPESVALAQEQKALYSRYRSRQFVDFWPIVFAQHNVSFARTPGGEYIMQCRSMAHCDVAWFPHRNVLQREAYIYSDDGI